MFLNSQNIRKWLAGFGVIVLLFCGCTKRAFESAMPVAEETMMTTAEQAPMGQARLKVAAGRVAPASPADIPTAGIITARTRMIHHDGFMHLRTPRPGELADEATRIVEARGGYVERLDSDTAVFRVPVEAFQTVFKLLLGLGDVLDKSITTEDITDAFMDVDLRLNIARTTRQRLVELLAKAKSEKEKIRILREIQRISIRIETLSAQRDRLLSKARFSSITVHIEARKLDRTTARREAIAAFEWIRRLSPFDDRVALSGKPLKFNVPEGMVALDQKGLWMAESADGAVMQASKHIKQPVGDTAFWLEAVRLRLSPDYAAARILDVGDFKILRLEDRSETPYIYLVGLRVARNQLLEVVEIYYPSPTHESRYKEKVFTSIDRGAR